MPRIPRQIVLSLALTGSLCACDRSPTKPPYTGKPVQPILGYPACIPVQSEIHCTVSQLKADGWSDVTANATWIVSLEPDVDVNTDIASIDRPGVITPRRPGKIYIRVRYDGGVTMAARSYAVAPGMAPVEFAPYLGAVVTEGSAQPSEFRGAGIPGVRMEILSPASEVGRETFTTEFGGYMFKHLPPDVPITVRASKAGYVSVIKTNTGITVSGLGGASNTGLLFELQRVQ